MCLYYPFQPPLKKVEERQQINEFFFYKNNTIQKVFHYIHKASKATICRTVEKIKNAFSYWEWRGFYYDPLNDNHRVLSLKKLCKCLDRARVDHDNCRKSWLVILQWLPTNPKWFCEIFDYQFFIKLCSEGNYSRKRHHSFHEKLKECTLLIRRKKIGMRYNYVENKKEKNCPID